MWGRKCYRLTFLLLEQKHKGKIPNWAIQKLLVIHFYFLIDLLRKAVKHCCYCLHIAYFLVLERSIISNEGESEIQSNLCFFVEHWSALVGKCHRSFIWSCKHGYCQTKMRIPWTAPIISAKQIHQICQYSNNEDNTEILKNR